MRGKILVTDSLFIFDEHEKAIKEAGFEIVRIDKPVTPEAELIDAIKDVDGYILGGVERVTEPVIAAASKLRVISFTGSGYAEFIPAHGSAGAKGIKITTAKGGNAKAVAQFAVTEICMMARKIPLLTSRGGSSFLIADNFEDIVVGIVGLGSIGTEVAKLLMGLGFKVLGTKRSATADVVGDVELVTLSDLIARSSIVSVHVDKIHGEHVLGRKEIEGMKAGAAIVNAAFAEAIDLNAAIERVLRKELFLAMDAAIDQRVDFPVGFVLASNAQTAFNTHSANRTISNMVTKSLLNVLAGNSDPYLVN